MNPKMEKARELLRSALEGVKAEMQQAGELYQYLVACSATPGVKPADEASKSLRDIEKELTRMLQEVESGEIDRSHQQNAWLGHVVVDNWPWKHPLTELVLKAERTYLKI